MRTVFFLIFLLCFQNLISFAQTTLATDSSVKVFPHWKKGETHNLSIQSTTEEITDGKQNKSSTGFDARFTVGEKDTSGYTIEWVYIHVSLPVNEINPENFILSGLVNQKLLFKLSLTGRFKEIENYEEVKTAFDNAIEKLIRGSANEEARNLGFKGARQMMTNRRNLEIVLLKQIKFYTLSFGYKYKKNFIQTNSLSFPNAMGGKPFDATEKVELKSLDTTRGICIIERSSQIDDVDALKNAVFSYLQQVTPKDSVAIKNYFSNNSFEFSEKSTQQINYIKGIPVKSVFTRIINFGFEIRNTVLEIDTID